ncbi:MULTISPECIES: NADH-quinone oxidoreductase subunit C [Chryseobacterium]|jgi:NADH:ubiquinone oxidoreductase 27 kD subunit|uniref:NADH-quinone oxidoreductase n=1 Tax=Chryseobacterium rhizosphaerae TaxID=395937 RepID=A0AAE4C645_9FLAO|nr:MULTISPECIES: NADH-quinone oxidoreductase subunit C [Chryseobacterium]MBL3550325.1 NADH-quinone oxidoreductase subunit C [Chryseobacterium sp. KMC2]MDC8101681.1 NADH-quinone oxidoreductase subunit C [Chryseobacterium rhizosphaerae]MDR6528290.1 NADH-quinone oxidoreductase subunit C [Chryseobacterium rhizosphaerae]REC75926.1 NADH-quinone oxidoreductase subunit C [Chryseobacterium rhizosphaerae]SMC86941.1 NADH-quinone oxidoreductase subunit C [Chryseobacterium sp. YR221]
MTNEFVLEAITREFPESVISSSEPYGMLTIEVKKEDIKKIIHYLKDSSLEINFLTDICGIHYPEFPDKEIGVVYHLHNMMANFRLRLKIFMSRENIEVDSLVELYAGANWMERETFDFYGIKFKGHPDLRPILNMEDLGYHPMLKEYRLEDGTRTDKDDNMFGR